MSTSFDEVVVRVAPVGARAAFAVWHGSADEVAASAAFAGDANADGVPDGLAWLLGAISPGSPAADLLPALHPEPDVFAYAFTLRSPASRGDAVMKIEYSADLVTWTGVPVPDTTQAREDLDFEVTPADDRVEVRATFPRELLGEGRRVFVRLRGELAAP